MENDVIQMTLTYNNGLCVTSFVDKDVKKVVLVPKKDYFEIWDNEYFVLLEKRLKLKLLQATTNEDLFRYQEKLEKMLVILSNGRRFISGFDNGGKFVSLRNDFVEKYHLNYLKGGITVEKKEDHFRVWKTEKYDFCQKNLSNKELLIRKIKERKNKV